jgi:hypothetical protein
MTALAPSPGTSRMEQITILSDRRLDDEQGRMSSSCGIDLPPW